MKYRLATVAEKLSWRQDGGLYPLHAIIENDGHEFPLEDLRSWGRFDPQWEVHAPKGHHFDSDMTHTILEWNVKDIKAAVLRQGVEPCTPDVCGE